MLLQAAVLLGVRKAKQQEIEQWLSSHEMRRNRVDTLLKTPLAVEQSLLMKQLSHVQNSPTLVNAFQRLPSAQQAQVSDRFVTIVTGLERLPDYSSQKLDALQSWVQFFNQSFDDKNLHTALNDHLQKWSRAFFSDAP